MTDEKINNICNRTIENFYQKQFDNFFIEMHRKASEVPFDPKVKTTFKVDLKNIKSIPVSHETIFDKLAKLAEE